MGVGDLDDPYDRKCPKVSIPAIKGRSDFIDNRCVVHADDAYTKRYSTDI